MRAAAAPFLVAGSLLIGLEPQERGRVLVFANDLAVNMQSFRCWLLLRRVVGRLFLRFLCGDRLIFRDGFSRLQRSGQPNYGNRHQQQNGQRLPR